MVHISGNGDEIQEIKLDGRVVTKDTDSKTLYSVVESLAKLLLKLRLEENNKNVR